MPGKQKKPRVTRREKKAQVVSLVEAANLSQDIVTELKNLNIELFTLKSEHDCVDLKIEYQSSKMLKEEHKDQMFDLLKTNMQALYEESDWGWNETKKNEELFDENAKYLIVKDNDERIVAFTHFRFEVEINHPILYCYELMISENIQRKGLGNHLMNILFLLAHKFKLVKILLTVFTNNTPALDFFMKSLGFRRDETCPYEEEGKCYIILSKCLDKNLINDIKSKMHAI